jgi:energy-coupling factor transport system substrate-specific component
VRVACQWAIYPLGRQEHMPLIYDAIAATKRAGVFTRGQHFASRLDGELGDVFGAIRAAFQATCERGGHVVAHATLSANSPSTKNANAANTANTPRSEPK